MKLVFVGIHMFVCMAVYVCVSHVVIIPWAPQSFYLRKHIFQYVHIYY